MFYFLIKSLLVIVIIVLVIGFWRTRYIQNDPRRQIFLHGTLPNPLPDGFYNGTVSGAKHSWLGKKFSASNSNGVNVFDDGFNSRNERYPFTTFVGKGLQDKNTDVLKIDYSVKGNPLWVRWILDEIVQVAPNEYLGKMHIRLIPGFPFSVLYFELKK